MNLIIKNHNWLDWFNNIRKLEPLGYTRRAELEELYCQHQDVPAAVVGLNERSRRKSREVQDYIEVSKGYVQ